MTAESPELASAQQQRMREMMKLAQTRLRNIEDELKRLHALRNNLSRHHDLFVAQEEHSKRLYQLNKESAATSREAEDLERFETFESIMVPFLRMQLLNDEAAENRRQGNTLEQELQDTDRQIEEKRKTLKECSDILSEAESRFLDDCRKLQETCCLDGQKATYQEMARQTGSILQTVEERLAGLRHRSNELADNTGKAETRLATLENRRHSMESHENLLDNTDQILELLNNLENIESEDRHHAEERQANTQELVRQNEILSNVKSQLADVNRKIQNLQDELNVHRTNIRGMQSYNVQEKVLELKSRIQMLLSAQSLWRRIGTGYATIEQKSHQIDNMRQQIEYDLHNEQELTLKVQNLRRQVKDREYSLTISKSQNVVQLRADLHEGTACTVCGSTHHPFHSDTMLEQSKLISDMRSEFETMKLELDGLRNKLHQLHDNLTKTMGQLVAEQQNLEIVRLRQDEDVKEWAVYSSLDPTFQECRPGTDSEARMATIRQLLDNSQRDLQTASAELKDFNYHSSQIDILSEQIATLEEKKDELISQMSGVDTTCQIISVRIDYLNSVIKTLDERYHQLYDQLNTAITLPEWYRQWQGNPTQLRGTLRLMRDEWKEINARLDEERSNVKSLHIQQDMTDDIIAEVATTQEQLRETARSITEETKRIDDHRETLMCDRDTNAALERSIARLHEARQRMHDAQASMDMLTGTRNTKQGALAGLRLTGRHLDQQASSQQSRVDMWIHAYNAHHPPVQYQELSDILTRDIDWTEKRRRVRQNAIDTLLEEQTVKALQAEIVGLQIDTGTLTDEQLEAKIHEVERNIVIQEESQRQTLMQIARYKIQLGLE